jgi:4-carboxymuconolactone decarboxylase
VVAMTNGPRIPPLPKSARDDRTEELLRSMRRDPDGDDLNIFATLAHHPRLLKRWSAFGGTLLYRGALPPRERELLILRTARNCTADYEWHQHVAIGLDAGLTHDEVAALATHDDTAWSKDDRTLLRAADELHTDSVIGDQTWERLSTRFDHQQLIEICMVVGQYHLVAFTLNSLGVEIEPASESGTSEGNGPA